MPEITTTGKIVVCASFPLQTLSKMYALLCQGFVLVRASYLNWDGNFHTYQRLFNHSAVLRPNNVIVGLDEDKAFVKVKLTLCTRHLEENLKRKLKNKIGIP